jgi:hypothetical protein
MTTVATNLETRAAIERFNEAVARKDVEEIFTAGDRAIVRWTHPWEHSDGERGHVRGIDVFRVVDGKVAEKLSYVKG